MDLDSVPDADLLAAYCRGGSAETGEDPFSVIVARHGAMVYRTCLRSMCGKRSSRTASWGGSSRKSAIEKGEIGAGRK